MSNPEVWRTWEGRTVDGKFPLRQWLGGSDHSAVFLTERPGQASRKAAIKMIAAGAADATSQLSQWRAAAQLSHPNLISIYESGRFQHRAFGFDRTHSPIFHQIVDGGHKPLLGINVGNHRCKPVSGRKVQHSNTYFGLL